VSYDYDRTAASTPRPTGKDVAEEVISTRVDGKSIQQHINDFLTEFIASAQTCNRRIEQANKTVEGHFNNEVKASRKEMQAAVMKAMEKKWGKDRMAPLLADALANQEYIW